MTKRSDEKNPDRSSEDFGPSSWCRRVPETVAAESGNRMISVRGTSLARAAGSGLERGQQGTQQLRAWTRCSRRAVGTGDRPAAIELPRRCSVRNPSISRPPYIDQHFVQRRVMFLQFGAGEGIEIVPVKIRLGALGEVLLVISQAVVPHLFAGVEQHVGV